MADIKITDIMSKNVVSVNPEMPLFEAAKILADHNFDGVPVIDKDNKLVGILTEYDLISKGSAIHLPTFQKLLKEIGVFGKDKSHFKKEFQDVISLKVKDTMNADPLTLKDSVTYEEVVETFREHHRVNPIPVVDQSGRVVGVVSRFDVLKPLRSVDNEP